MKKIIIGIVCALVALTGIYLCWRFWWISDEAAPTVLVIEGDVTLYNNNGEIERLPVNEEIAGKTVKYSFVSGDKPTTIKVEGGTGQFQLWLLRKDSEASFKPIPLLEKVICAVRVQADSTYKCPAVFSEDRHSKDYLREVRYVHHCWMKGGEACPESVRGRLPMDMFQGGKHREVTLLPNSIGIVEMQSPVTN